MTQPTEQCMMLLPLTFSNSAKNIASPNDCSKNEPLHDAISGLNYQKNKDIANIGLEQINMPGVAASATFRY